MAVLSHGDLPRGEMGGIISLAVWQDVCQRNNAPFHGLRRRFVHGVPRNLKWPGSALVQFAFRSGRFGKIVSIYVVLQLKPGIALAAKTALNTASGIAGQGLGRRHSGTYPVIRKSSSEQHKQTPRPGELVRRGGVGFTEAWQ